ncbi:MAG: hypothetical protein GOV01_03730 [Candidatus Altiarchaeota archaeon]|nr:hypothetical protein [Candidatus Altiarchaeota archaeon]
MGDIKRLFDAESKASELLSKAREKASLLEDISDEELQLKKLADARASEDSKKLFIRSVNKKVKDLKHRIKLGKERLGIVFLESEKRIPRLSKELAKDLVKHYE